MTIFWGLFFLALFLGGIYLALTKPIAKKYDSTPYLDLGTGGFLILVALIYFWMAYVAPEYSEDDPAAPCSSKSPQALCYGLDTSTCEDAWKSFDDVCEEEVKPIREKKPSALLYPLTFKCHAQKFDKIAFYNRRRSDIPACREYFKKLER